MMLNNEIEYFPESAQFHGSIPLIMGTRLDLVILGQPEDPCGKLWSRVCAETLRQDCLLNRFAPESELSKIISACNMPNYPIAHYAGTLYSATSGTL